MVRCGNKGLLSYLGMSSPIPRALDELLSVLEGKEVKAFWLARTIVINVWSSFLQTVNF